MEFTKVWQQEVDCEENKKLIKILSLIGINKIIFRFSGSGDSGNIELENISWLDVHSDGKPFVQLELSQIPYLEFEEKYYGHPKKLEKSNLSQAIYTIADRTIGRGWENNEGSWGSIEILPFDLENPISYEMNDNESEEDWDENDTNDQIEEEFDPEDQQPNQIDSKEEDVHADIAWDDNLPSQLPNGRG